MFKNLKFRILFLLIGLTSSIIIAFSLLLYYSLENTINEEVEKQLFTQASYVYEELLNKRDIIDFSEKNALLDIELAIQKDNEIIKRTKKFRVKKLNKLYKKNERSFFLIKKKNHVENALFILRFNKPFKGAIYILKKDIHKEANKIKTILWILNPLLLLFLIITSIKLVNKIFISVQNVSRAAKNVSITNFSHTIDLPNDEGEIKTLVVSFNNMIERLKEGIERLDRFNSDVSHELKTPLTVILGEVELSLKKPRDNGYYINSLKTISFEARQLESIVKNLLILTRYTKENIEQTFNLCNMDALLLDAIDKYEKELLLKNIELKIKRVEPLVFNGNPQLLNSIFTNLIDNAIKYSNENTEITIELFKDKKINFIISDEGIGISSIQLKKVMDRFYRIEESRNKKIKGFGLGLSIVKNSVNLHGGEIQISSKLEKGTKVIISF